MLFKTFNLKNFSKFTEKHLCCSLFLIKLQAFRPATSLKRDSDTDVSCGYCKIFKYSFFIEHLRWLLLIVQPQYRCNKVSWGVYCAFDFDQNLKQYIAKIIPYYNIVFTPLPFPLEGRIEIFKMDGGGGGLTGPQLSDGGCWERGGDIFQGGCNFQIKNKLKSEIFKEKKSLWAKILFCHN